IALKLINLGADVNIETNSGRTALSLLCDNSADEQQLVTATALINRGADVNTCYRDTPLGYALQVHNIELAIKLIDLGAQFMKHLDEKYTKYPRYADYIRKKYNESILAAMNDECSANAFALSFKKTYVPQLITMMVAFIL
ncbi:MAG: hypothetical protein Faunusvirus20_1, partial [Faunusvirus sp.]